MITTQLHISAPLAYRNALSSVLALMFNQMKSFLFHRESEEVDFELCLSFTAIFADLQISYKPMATHIDFTLL